MQELLHRQAADPIDRQQPLPRQSLLNPERPLLGVRTEQRAVPLDNRPGSKSQSCRRRVRGIGVWEHRKCRVVRSHLVRHKRRIHGIQQEPLRQAVKERLVVVESVAAAQRRALLSGHIPGEPDTRTEIVEIVQQGLVVVTHSEIQGQAGSRSPGVLDKARPLRLSVAHPGRPEPLRVENWSDTLDGRSGGKRVASERIELQIANLAPDEIAAGFEGMRSPLPAHLVGQLIDLRSSGGVRSVALRRIAGAIDHDLRIQRHRVRRNRVDISGPQLVDDSMPRHRIGHLTADGLAQAVPGCRRLVQASHRIVRIVVPISAAADPRRDPMGVAHPVIKLRQSQVVLKRAHVKSGDGTVHKRSAVLVQALIVTEEIGASLGDRAAHCSALLQQLVGNSQIRQRGPCLNSAGPAIEECFSVKFVRTRFRGGDHQADRSGSMFRIELVGQHPEFLDRGNRQTLQRAVVEQSVVVGIAVQPPLRVAKAGPVDRKTILREAIAPQSGSVADPGIHQREAHEISAVGGKVRQLLGRNHGAEFCRLRDDIRSGGDDFDRRSLRRDREGHIESRDFARRNVNPFGFPGLHPRGVHRHFVIASRSKTQKSIPAARIGRGRFPETQGLAAQFDEDAWNRGSFGVQ